MCRQAASEQGAGRATLGIDTRVRFHGRVGHDAVLREMASALAVVVPSRSEAFGLVNIEAMAVGSCVIASAAGGIGEIIEDEVNGLLVQPGNAAHLAEALHRVAANADWALHLGHRARAVYLERFAPEQMIGRQVRWLEGVLEGTSSHRSIEGLCAY